MMSSKFSDISSFLPILGTVLDFYIFCGIGLKTDFEIKESYT